MKIRTDFVTNSSSSSFIALGVQDEELAEMFQELLDENGRVAAVSEFLGGIKIDGACVTITTLLDYVDYHGCYEINGLDPENNRDFDEVFGRDSKRAKKLQNFKNAFRLFDVSKNALDMKRVDEAISRAFKEKHVKVKVYFDETDGFSLENFSSDFGKSVPSCFTIEKNILYSYNEKAGKKQKLIIPSSVFRICGDNVFKGTNFKTVIFNSYHVEICGNSVFADCKNLEKIDFPSGNQFIKENTFKGCENLEYVKLPYDIYGIEKGAFAGCKKLKSINIPEELQFIEEGAFDGCDELEKNNPELWNRIHNFSKERSKYFDRKKESERYILENGLISFPTTTNFKYIEEKRKELEQWHSEYDQYIDKVSILERKKKFSLFARPYAEAKIQPYSDAIEEIAWRKVKDFNEFTDVLVIDTKDILDHNHFIIKADAIKRGNLAYAKSMGKTKHEKAVESKKEGKNILIITLDNFVELLENRSFGELSDEEIQKEREKQERQAERERIEAEKELACNIEWIEDKMRLLASRYEGKEKPTTARQVETENPDICNNVFKYAFSQVGGVKFVDLCLKFGVFSQGHTAVKEEPKAVEYIDNEIDYSGVLYQIGEEPKNIRARIDTLFPKLEGAYPDKVIYGLNRLHSKWGETVTVLYRQLGYKSGNDFLRAYGFNVKKESGGRPKKVDPNEIIEELKRRYPNGVSSIEQIKKENPDIKLQNLMNQSKTLFGTTFVRYLTSLGLLKKEDEKSSFKSMPTKLALFNEVKKDTKAEIEEKSKADAELEDKKKVEEKARIEREAKEKAEAEARARADAEIAAKKEAKEKANSILEKSAKSIKYVTPPMSDFEFSGDTIKKYKGKAKNILLPDGFVVVGEEAFYNNSTLEAIKIPEGFKTIKSLAFSGCKKLKNIDFPPSLEEIERGGFSACPALTCVEIPKGVKKLAIAAFWNCPSVEKIVIPAETTDIADNAFGGCRIAIYHVIKGSKAEKIAKKTRVVYALYAKEGDEPKLIYPEKPDFASQDIGSYYKPYVRQLKTKERGIGIVGKKLDYLLGASGGIELPSGLDETAGHLGLSMKEVTALSIPKGYTTSGDYAFSDMKKMKYLSIPSTFNNVGESAFSRADALERVDLAEGLRVIGNYMFHEAKKLAEIKMPTTLKKIGDGAFKNCEKLNLVILNRGLEEIGSDAFGGCKKLESLYIPASVKKIGEEAFLLCPTLVLYVEKGSYAEQYAKENKCLYFCV